MVECCTPYVCCTRCNREPQNKDACMCGCGYLNGGGQVAAAQCLLLLGVFFSVAAMGDCAFFSIAQEVNFSLSPEPEDPIPEDEAEEVIITTDTFGFITFEQEPNGRCYWYDTWTGYTSLEQYDLYFRLLGSDVQLARIFGLIGTGGGLLQFLYSLSFCCSSQTKSVRIILAFLISIALTTFQGLSLLVLTSEFCDEHICTFERAAGFSCAATGCYFFAGIMYLIMSEYPGATYMQQQKQAQAALHQQTNANDNDEEDTDLEQPSNPTSPMNIQEEDDDDDDVDPGMKAPIQPANSNEFTDTFYDEPQEQEIEIEEETPVEQEVEVEEPTANQNNSGPDPPSASMEARQQEQASRPDPTPAEPATKDEEEEVVEEEEVEEEEVVEEEVVEEEEEVVEEEVVVEDNNVPQTAEEILLNDDNASTEPMFVDDEDGSTATPTHKNTVTY